MTYAVTHKDKLYKRENGLKFYVYLVLSELMYIIYKLRGEEK